MGGESSNLTSSPERVTDSSKKLATNLRRDLRQARDPPAVIGYGAAVTVRSRFSVSQLGTTSSARTTSINGTHWSGGHRFLRGSSDRHCSMSGSDTHVTDVALSRRLERAEAKASAAYVDSRALTDPSLGAEWRDFGGTYAMFDGVGSPLSQTFGLGLFSPATHEQLEEIESFFRDRGAEVFHEVSPLADRGAARLARRARLSPDRADERDAQRLTGQPETLGIPMSPS